MPMENPSPPPQWAPDPMGRYAQRFWDGTAWTDFVATADGGEPTTDPLVEPSVAAQWAPDPTGRYVQRYWDGDAWTGFVATAAGGAPATDPLEPGGRWPAPMVAPVAAAAIASADPEPQPEWIGTHASRRRGLRLSTWLALGLAVVVGVAFAITRGSGGTELPTASSTRDGAPATPSSTGPGGPTTTTHPTGTPNTTGPAGSGSTGKKSTSTTTRPPTPPTTAKPAAAAAPPAHSVNSTQDQAVADRAALTVADLPQGFRAESSTPSQALDSSFPECRAFHTRLAGTNAVASAKSPDFADAGQRVTSTVHLLVTQSQAASVVDMLHDPALRSCLDRVFANAARVSIARSSARSSAAPVTAENVQVEPLTVAPVGDQRAGLRVVTTVTTGGVTVPMSADLVAFRVGRAAVLSVFESPSTAAARDAVLAAISHRLRHAGAGVR
jgi:hypothetical protein